MSSDSKKPINGSGNFRAKLDHVLYSGEKKHVVAGIAIIGVIFGIPWYLMNRAMKLALEPKENRQGSLGNEELRSFGRSTSLIKITWIEPIKLEVKDFLLVRPQLDEDKQDIVNGDFFCNNF